MAMIHPIDGDVFQRRREELARKQVDYGAGTAGAPLSTGQALSLVPAGIDLLGSLTTPVIGGIAEAARKSHEQQRIEAAKRANADAGVREAIQQSAGQRDIDAGQANMQRALEERDAMGSVDVPPEMVSSQVRPQGPAVQPIDALASVQPQGMSPRAVPVQNADQMEMGKIGTSADSYLSALADIAAKRVDATRPKPMPVEQAIPQLPTQMPVQARTMRSTETEAPVQTQERQVVPRTLAELQQAAMIAGASGDLEEKRKVLQELSALGEDAYAPQSWAELFNPSLARRRVMGEFGKLINPEHHGLSAIQEANYASLIKKREQDMRDKAALQPIVAELRAAQADVARKRAEGLDVTNDLNRIEVAYRERVRQAGIDRDLADAAYKDELRTDVAPAQAAQARAQAFQGIPAQAGLNRVRAQYVPYEAETHRISAEKPPASFLFNPQAERKEAEKDVNKLTDELGKVNAELKKLDEVMNDAPPPIDSPQFGKWAKKHAVFFDTKNIPDIIAKYSAAQADYAKQKALQESLNAQLQDAMKRRGAVQSTPAAPAQPSATNLLAP